MEPVGYELERRKILADESYSHLIATFAVS